jgi:hypothetical protein
MLKVIPWLELYEMKLEKCALECVTLKHYRSPAMDGNLKTSPVKELEEHGLPKLDTGKLIIDTDAGVDDAVALLLALGYEAKQPNSSSRIIAVTCVFGNTDVNNVVVNVLKVLKTANRLDVSFPETSRLYICSPLFHVNQLPVCNIKAKLSLSLTTYHAMKMHPELN